MACELKQTEIKTSFYCVGVSYCDLQHLTAYLTRAGYYASNYYGWRGDVFLCDNWAICTGYKPIQNIKINEDIKRKIIKKYDELGKQLTNDYDCKNKIIKAYKLLMEFINEIRKNCEW